MPKAVKLVSKWESVEIYETPRETLADALKTAQEVVKTLNPKVEADPENPFDSPTEIRFRQIRLDRLRAKLLDTLAEAWDLSYQICARF